jgi:hypothetical protein
MVIKFIADGKVVGKLADAEIHFEEGALAGLKLCGFAVWESRGQRRNVTFPARTYKVNGEARSFALLRPNGTRECATDGIRDLILDAYKGFEVEHGTIAAAPDRRQVRAVRS